MKEVNFWALKRKASDVLRDRLDWHISGPSILSINELMDEPAGGVYHRLGLLVVFERMGRVIINEHAVAKINVGGFDDVERTSRGEQKRKRFFNWPLR